MLSDCIMAKWIGLLFAIALAAVATAEETVSIKVDFNSPAGKIRRLHGMNLAAPLTNARNSANVTQDLKKLDIPVTRFHDASLENRGMQLVDVSRVFPLFHADPQNPDNYYFAQTDDYIANCLATGSKVSYRFGETIEHSKKQYFVHPPRDYDKWADICINIIRHYNEGWANGFQYNIDYWHIWEEPDNVPSLWTGSWDDFIRLYVTTARKVKQRFPNLKVGGPAMMDAVGWQSEKALARVDTFLKECRRQDAPLDFFSWNCYTDDPDRILKEPGTLRKVLDGHGFSKTELHLTEWHYIPKTAWADLSGAPEAQERFPKTINGINGSAFLCAILSGLQDTPVDMANYYTGSTLRWGFYDFFGARNKCYFGTKAFNMLTKYENRVRVRTPANAQGIWVLAGRKESGQAAILVSCFKSPQRQIKLDLENYDVRPEKCKVYILDAEHDLEPLPSLSISGSEITLPKPEGSAVLLVELL